MWAYGVGWLVQDYYSPYLESGLGANVSHAQVPLRSRPTPTHGTRPEKRKRPRAGRTRDHGAGPHTAKRHTAPTGKRHTARDARVALGQRSPRLPVQREVHGPSCLAV